MRRSACLPNRRRRLCGLASNQGEGLELELESLVFRGPALCPVCASCCVFFAFGAKAGRWLVLVAQLALRGGGAGDSERDVPGGARHRQRPLLGALRLHQVRPARLPHLRGTYCSSFLYLASTLLLVIC